MWYTKKKKGEENSKDQIVYDSIAVSSQKYRYRRTRVRSWKKLTASASLCCNILKPYRYESEFEREERSFCFPNENPPLKIYRYIYSWRIRVQKRALISDISDETIIRAIIIHNNQGTTSRKNMRTSPITDTDPNRESLFSNRTSIEIDRFVSPFKISTAEWNKMQVQEQDREERQWTKSIYYSSRLFSSSTLKVCKNIREKKPQKKSQEQNLFCTIISKWDIHNEDIEDQISSRAYWLKAKFRITAKIISDKATSLPLKKNPWNK